MIEELNGDFIQWLRGFYYIAETGSIRRAAQLMNRSASTLSYQLKELEENLNTVLFDRYRKGMLITPEGRKLLDWTISTFETLKGLRSEVGTLRRNKGPHHSFLQSAHCAQDCGQRGGVPRRASRSKHPHTPGHAV